MMNANWLHLIWATADHIPWIKPDKQQEICRTLQMACRRHGLYLELAAAQPEHLHVLLRLHHPHAESRLRALLFHICRLHVRENLSPVLAERLRFEDYSQPIGRGELRHIRAHILQQDRWHEAYSFGDELNALELDSPNTACIMLGAASARVGLRGGK